MALIVKSSIDILPWTEMEKQKLIEEKEEFLSKKEIEQGKEVKNEAKNEVKNEAKNETPKQKEEKNKNTAKKSTEKEDKKKEVNE